MEMIPPKFPSRKRVTVAELFDEYEIGSRSIDDFDDGLWLFACDRVGDSREIDFLPVPVQYYYASRFLEWDVGNGGFAQAAFNIPYLFETARLGYLALDLSAAAALIAEAQTLIAQGHAQFSNSGHIGDLFEEFAESRLTELDARLDASGWWATQERVSYASAHRTAFESLA